MVTRNIGRLGAYARAAAAGWHVRNSATDEERQQARRHLVERLGQLRGLPGKMSQLLTLSVEDTADADVERAIRPAPLALETVRGVLEQQWQRPLDSVLRHIAPQAIPASLGQVHRATLLDGRDVAVKVQYPGMRDALRMDLNVLGWLSLPAPAKIRGFDLPGYQATILEDMERELDYRQEAANQRRFLQWAAEEPLLVVPEIIESLSTASVLVTIWEDGGDLADVQGHWSSTEKQQLGHALARVFHEGVLSRGLLHADWHAGNFRFRRGNQGVKVLLYDFGCVFEPQPTQVAALLRLIRATRDESESPYPLLLALGFRAEYLAPIEHKLPALCKVLLAPYLAPYPFPLADWQLSARFNDILREDRWNFRVAGPPALIFLVRAFHGLISFLRTLKVTTSWGSLVQPLLESRKSALDQFELPPTSTRPTTFAGLAKHLKIRVDDEGCTKVQLTYPASAVDHLPDLIDEHVRNLIAQRGIDLGQLVAQVRERAYAPSRIFSLLENRRQISVWLE